MGSPHWSASEVAYLARRLRAGDTLSGIAKHLRRSENAARLKARRLGLARRAAGGDEPLHSLDELTEALGVTRYRLAQWRAQGWLKPTPDGKYRRADLRTFLRRHGQEINFAHVQPGFFLALVLGPAESSSEGSEPGQDEDEDEDEMPR